MIDNTRNLLCNYLYLSKVVVSDAHHWFSRFIDQM